MAFIKKYKLDGLNDPVVDLVVKPEIAVPDTEINAFNGIIHVIAALAAGVKATRGAFIVRGRVLYYGSSRLLERVPVNGKAVWFLSFYNPDVYPGTRDWIRRALRDKDISSDSTTDNYPLIDNVFVTMTSEYGPMDMQQHFDRIVAAYSLNNSIRSSSRQHISRRADLARSLSLLYARRDEYGIKVSTEQEVLAQKGSELYSGLEVIGWKI